MILLANNLLLLLFLQFDDADDLQELDILVQSLEMLGRRQGSWRSKIEGKSSIGVLDRSAKIICSVKGESAYHLCSSISWSAVEEAVVCLPKSVFSA